MTPNEALQALLEGNRRYVADRPRHPHQRATHRKHVAAGQHPFAVVLGCADSRVPPEIIFDEGIGDLFVVRSAGHIVDDAIVGSLEYAVAEFGAPLVLVLGHERCGAVRAAVEVAEDQASGEPVGHIGAVVSAILPAVRDVAAKEGDHVANAVDRNVARVVEELRTDEPILAPRVRDGTLRVVGARYNLETGTVDVIVP